MNSKLTEPDFWDEYRITGSKKYPTPRTCRKDYEMLKLLHPFLEPKRGGKFIEMGCGGSYLLPYYGKTYDFEIYGVDFSMDRLMQTHENLYAAGVPSRLKCCDLNNLPDEWADKFDVVYSHGVIEHFAEPGKILNAFAKCLKPGGLMVTTVPHLKGFWGVLGRALNKTADSGYVCLDLSDLTNDHKNAGLEITCSTYFRWLDFSMLVYTELPQALRGAVYVGIDILNLPLSRLLGQRYHAWLPDALYSDMLVVARKAVC